MVNQRTFICNESILENIRYGKPNATEVKVRESAIAAQADRFIQQLPNGYHNVSSLSSIVSIFSKKQLSQFTQTYIVITFSKDCRYERK